MPVMIDLETLAVTPDAIMLSIGACEFSYTKGTNVPGSRFYRRVTPIGQEYARFDPKTLAWHMRLPDTAREEMARCLTEGENINRVLCDFADWLAHVKSDNGPEDSHIWSHGATFDIPILIYHLARNGWNHDAVFGSHRVFRDTRTLYDNVGFKDLPEGTDFLDFMLSPGGRPSKTVKMIGVAHNALDDAIYQADCVASVYQGRKGLVLTRRSEA